MKELIVIGDRVLVKPEETEEKTSVGLYLPQTVRDRDDVIRGHIIKTGPGIPLADPSSLGEEPWSAASSQSPRYLPMEAREGDYALFLRKAAVEIHYKGEKYFIVPQSALLVLIRDVEEPPADLDSLSPDLSIE
jgi:co-chaperonin GroES (HSP10)